MPPNESDSDNVSLKTTNTMRQKAKAFGNCLISLLKIWRLCCRKKTTKNNV